MQPLSRRRALALGVGALALACSRSERKGGEGEDAGTKPADESWPRPVAPGGRMPVLFVGHGSPTLAIDLERGAEMRSWGQSLIGRFGQPKAIVIVSSHWQATPITIGATTPQPLIRDIFDVPEELWELEYAPPGAPELAERVAALLPGDPRRKPDRGLDHGAWAPLVHLAPEADVPVLQLSVPSGLHPAELVDTGRALAPLRDEGVWLIGSGNITHNLSSFDKSETIPPPEWAKAVDSWAAEVLAARDLDRLIAYRGEAPDFERAHPTEEHWHPLMIVAGAGLGGPGGERARVSFPITGFELGTVSRRCVEIA